MNTYIIYFVSVINCYVSAQLIFDHFKINFNSTYSKKWIYNIVTISVGVLIGIKFCKLDYHSYTCYMLTIL